MAVVGAFMFHKHVVCSLKIFSKNLSYSKRATDERYHLATVGNELYSLLYNQVMLIASPSLDDLYHKSCSLSQDPENIQENFVHPTRLINFLVGVKGKNEPVAIGGPWSPSLDGPNPADDPKVLIKTAIRTTRALTGINLSSCTQW